MQVALLADNPQQRQQLELLLHQSGYLLVLNATPDRHLVMPSVGVDVWLVSLQDADGLPVELLEQLYDSGLPVVVDEARALIPGSQDYVRWQHNLTSKLALAVRNKLLQLPGWSDGQPAEVWLLAASLGGLPAVKEFLDNLPQGLPLSFLYAQHIEPGFEARLPRAVGRHSQWPVRLAIHGQQLQSGEVVVVPTRQQLDFAADGRLLLLDQPWQGQYSPCIEQLVGSLSRRFGRRSGLMVFSGMGEDGSAACAAAVTQGMSIWLQESASCVCPAMPDSVRKTGLSSYSAAPRQLALALSNHVKVRYGAPIKE